MRYDFFGNVRELENIIERGVAITYGDTIALTHLPDELRDTSGIPLQKKNGKLPTLEEHEREYIHWVLKEVGGNQTAAAQTLGINRSSLWRKLKMQQAK